MLKIKSRIFNKFLISVLCILIISSFSLSVYSQELKPDVLIWGSASLGSRGYVAIEAFSSTVNRLTDLQNSSISTAGGAENMALLDQGEIHLGQGMSSDLSNAYNGLAPYNKKIEFAQLFSYTIATLPIVTMMNSDIQTVEDLKGKKLQVGPASGGAVPVMRAVLEAYGILDEVEFVYQNWADAPDSLRLGQVDASAVWHTAGKIAHTGFQKLALTDEFRLVEMDKGMLEKVSEKNEGIVVGTTFKETFDFYTKDVYSPALSAIVMCDPDLGEETVYNIVKTIFDNEEEVISIDEQSLYGFGLSTALEYVVPTYPIHPGAARYYKEVGVWKNNLTIHE